MCLLFTLSQIFVLLCLILSLGSNFTFPCKILKRTPRLVGLPICERPESPFANFGIPLPPFTFLTNSFICRLVQKALKIRFESQGLYWYLYIFSVTPHYKVKSAYIPFNTFLLLLILPMSRPGYELPNDYKYSRILSFERIFFWLTMFFQWPRHSRKLL